MNSEDAQERELARRAAARDQRKGLRPAVTDKLEVRVKRFRKAAYLKYTPLFEAINRQKETTNRRTLFSSLSKGITAVLCASTLKGKQSQAIPPLGTVNCLCGEDHGPSCYDCGCVMHPNGSCFRCPNCGSTSGCS